MSRVTGKPPTHWRRPMTRTYDYNMSLGENYYKPQLEYINSRKGRGNTPPSASTFAERLLQYPPSRRSASATRRAEEAELGLSSATTSSASAAVREARESLGRYASLDDLGIDEDLALRRRKQLLSLKASQENLAADRGVSPLLSPAVERKNRVTFGEKMLDAIGVKEVQSKMQQKSSLFSEEEGDALDKILAERRSRRQQALTVQTADPDLFAEDPLKSPRISSRIQQARQEMDQMREDMKKDMVDTSASTSRFRQKLRAKREREAREEQESFGSLSALNDLSLSPAISSSSATASSALKALSSSSSAMKASSTMRVASSSLQNIAAEAAECDAETEAILGKVEQIRRRAKARLAQITDDFPDLQIESSLASRRAAKSRQALMDDEFDSDLMSSSRLNSSGSSGRAVTISKKTIRASYDVE